jgi:hypothetical protein
MPYLCFIYFDSGHCISHRVFLLWFRVQLYQPDSLFFLSLLCCPMFGLLFWYILILENICIRNSVEKDKK